MSQGTWRGTPGQKQGNRIHWSEQRQAGLSQRQPAGLGEPQTVAGLTSEPRTAAVGMRDSRPADSWRSHHTPAPNNSWLGWDDERLKNTLNEEHEDEE